MLPKQRRKEAWRKGKREEKEGGRAVRKEMKGLKDEGKKGKMERGGKEGRSREKRGGSGMESEVGR